MWMKKVFFAILLIAAIGSGFSQAFAAERNNGGSGRFQVVFNPTDPTISYMVDTQKGRMWRLAHDKKIGLLYWRVMPVEGLDYPVSSYPPKALQIFMKQKRFLLPNN